MESNIGTFFDRKPFAKVIDFDDETGHQVHKVRLTAKLPGRIKAIVKDVAVNLRSALDHAAYGSARALGALDPKRTGFPFADTAEAVLRALVSEQLSGNPPEIRPTLADFEPHANGNQMLWCLNRLRVPNTHRILSPVLLNAAGTSIGIARIQMTGGGGQIGYSKWDAERAEVEYMRLPQGSIYEYEVKVGYRVTFGNIDVLNEKDVIPTLRDMADEVERVVAKIEAETTRILTIRDAAKS